MFIDTEFMWVKKNIAENIKKMRKERSWTHLQLSEKMNVARSTITMLELNQQFASIVSLVKAAQAFGVSIDSLVGLTTSKVDDETIFENS